MSKSLRSLLALSLPALLILPLTLGCDHKSEASIQADAAAKAAEDKVAQLEKELADTKAGKAAEGDEAHLTKAHQKALEKQVADAKKRAAAKEHEAQALATAPTPKEAPKPVVVEVPTGTKLAVRLAHDLTTEKDEAGANWDGSLLEDVLVDGKLVWSAGTKVSGVVTQSHPAGRLSQGQGALGIRLTEVNGVGVDSDGFLQVADAKGERDAKYIAGGAAIGALIGILTDKNHKADHALGGAAVGAGAGTAVAAGTADTVVRILSVKPVTFTLTAPERITLK